MIHVFFDVIRVLKIAQKAEVSKEKISPWRGL